MNSNVAEIIVVIIYAAFDHLHIFAPSKFHNGIILNNPIHALIKNPELTTSFHNGLVIFMNNNGSIIIAIIILVIGPAMLIIPFCLLLILPNIITAPGAMNTNPKKLINNASSSMVLSARNSAQHL